MNAAQVAGKRPTGGTVENGGVFARSLVGWLGLAAAPTFAAMALWTVVFDAPTDMPCTAMPGSSAMGGMTPMYLLMSVFHSSPWLKRIAGRSATTARKARHVQRLSP
jgi:hypothetical protein